MRFYIVEPTKAVFEGDNKDLELIKSYLTYTNTSVSYLISKHSRNRFFKAKDPGAWAHRLNELKKEAKNTLVFEQNGLHYIRPGSLSYLKEAGFQFEAENHIEYPEAKPYAWKVKPPFELYPYQEESVRKLIEAKHGSVSLCTGAGKSLILLTLAQRMGLKALVVVPSKSIFVELLHLFETHLGKNRVGGIGNGKKDFKKDITVAIAKSLTMIEEDTPEWEFIQSKQVLAFDEVHTTAAKELEKVCHHLAKNIPYRFSMTGTQTRGDGALKLLQSITGPVVNELSTKDAIDGKYLSPIETRIIDVKSKSSVFVKDPGKMKRKHFLYNDEILQKAADIANAFGQKNRHTLILVEEIEQISRLSKLLKVPFGYIHGNTTKKDDLKKYGIEKSNLEETLLDFNMGKIKVLIGTDCISTGTNIFCHAGINLQGGASEIGVKQGIIGRMVRRIDKSRFAKFLEPKDKAYIFDFRVKDIEMMERHLQNRIKFYKETGCPVING